MRTNRLCFLLLLTAPAIAVPVSQATACEEYTFEGYGFYFYSDSYDDSTGCHARDGIWRVDLKTGEEEQIFGDNSGRYLISRCDLSYHGRQLLFHGASIGNGVINNDGSGYEKISADIPLTTENVHLYWTRLGVFRTVGGELRRYDIASGEYTVVGFPSLPGWNDNTFKGGTTPKMCLASGDGTRLWNRAHYKTISFGPKKYGYPTHGGHTTSHTFFILNEDGSPHRMFGRNFWGHGDLVTLDGEYVYWQDFGHEGWWIGRHSDGQKIADLRRPPLPVPAPGFHTACGEKDVVQDARRPMHHCTNDNEWFYLYTAPRFFGLPASDIDNACFFNTVWNRHTNSYVKVHGPEDGTWLPRCRSLTAVQLAGFWKGYDLPDINDTSPYLVAYQKEITFHCAKQTTPLDTTVRIGNINEGPLEDVTATVEPQSAESWLTPSLTHTDITITMTLRVDPGSLPNEDNQTATVTVQTASARNTASVKVHADKTMLPRPADFVVYHANMSDSFAYPELTWNDRADGEEGYVIEFHTNHNLNKTWRALDTLDANTVRYISRLHAYTEETSAGKYRIRAYTADQTFSPYSVEGYFCVPPDSLVPPDPAWIHEGWSEGDPLSAHKRRGSPACLTQPVVAPTVSFAHGRVRVAAGAAFAGGTIRLFRPEGRLVASRRIPDNHDGHHQLSLKSPAGGVVLLKTTGTSGISTATELVVLPHH